MLSVGRNTAQQWNKLLFPCRTSLGREHELWQPLKVNCDAKYDRWPRCSISVSKTRHIHRIYWALCHGKRRRYWNMRCSILKHTTHHPHQGRLIQDYAHFVPQEMLQQFSHRGTITEWSEHLKGKRKGSARKWMWWVALLDSTLHKSPLFFSWLVLRHSAFLFLFELNTWQYPESHHLPPPC